jgi:hypothetical protein
MEPATYSVPPRRSMRTLLIGFTITFILGLVAMGWLLTRTEVGRELVSQDDAGRSYAVAPAAAPAAVAAVPALPSGAPLPDQAARLAAIEARLAQIESRAASADGSGGSTRTESLLVAFATRRAVERGAPLGRFEQELIALFGPTHSGAVGAIQAALRAPVTLDGLNSDLQGLTPQLSGKPKDSGWWTSVTNGFSSLMVVRRTESESMDPVVRVEEARNSLSRGDVKAAIAELEALPNRAAAASWIANARRYAEAQRGLDEIEAAAFADASPRAMAEEVPAAEKVVEGI